MAFPVLLEAHGLVEDVKHWSPSPPRLRLTTLPNHSHFFRLKNTNNRNPQETCVHSEGKRNIIVGALGRWTQQLRRTAPGH